MRRTVMIALLLLLVAASASAQPPMQEELPGVQRELVAGDVAHYSARVRVGPGQYDEIEVHRVVRESSPWHPRPTAEALMMVHGDTIDWEMGFMVGPDDGSESSSMAAYLAGRDVDVWGISHRWTLVPITETDHAAFAAWDLDLAAGDVRTAMLIARAVRAATGSPAGRIDLLGWSRGGQQGYVVAQIESHLPNPHRHVRTYIPFETMMKTDDDAQRAGLCALADQVDSQIASGTFSDAGGAGLQPLGVLAEVDPDGPSPAIPGLTNRQAMLLFGGATHLFTPFSPTYHLIGASFGEGGIPTGFLFTEELAFFRAVQALPPFTALPVQAEGNRVVCEDTEHDDHLDEVDVPVFSVGGAGGLGLEGEFTTTLLSSSPDVDSLVVQLLPDEQRASDFGHDDVVRSTLAAELVWDPIVGWLLAH